MTSRVFQLLKSKKSKDPESTTCAAKLAEARALQAQGLLAEAEATCQEIQVRQPDHFESLVLLGELLVGRGNLEQAIQLYSKIIELRPDQALAHYKRGNLLMNCGRLEAALASYDQAVDLDPDYAVAFCNRGVLLDRLGRPQDALTSHDRAIALAPGDAVTYYNRGAVLRQLGRLDEALGSYDQAITLRPDYAQAHCNRGILLQELERWNDAMASFDQVIRIDSSLPLAHFYRGTLLNDRQQSEAAVASFDRAIAIDPNNADAHCNRGVALAALQQWDAALASFDRALNVKPDFAEVYRNRAIVLNHMQQFTAAIESYERALVIKPDFPFLFGVCRYAKMQLCEWGDFSADVARLTAGIEAGAAITPPFPVLALLDRESVHCEAAQIWVREDCPENGSLPAIPRRRARDRIRLGYFSSDFYDHPVAVLAAELFEIHDRSKFEVMAFSAGPDARDAMRSRLEGAFDRFIDVREMPDKDIALLARSLDIDIAIDLGGHTRNARTGVFARRAAPIQVNYLGYPGTMGAKYMDYLVADRTVVPESHQGYYAEKVAYMPNCYLPHDSGCVIADPAPTRLELGLPSTGFVFCCFNNGYKITPDTFDSWMRILSQADDSVLWLSQNNSVAASNLRREGVRRGIAAERLVFANRVPALPLHLARYRAADLFLDTRPYNAHATALDALWAGLPVLTCIGESFAGRVAASLLTAIDATELIASTDEQYEAMAVQLATNPQRLAQIAQKLVRNRLNTALFDAQLYAKHLEAAYEKMYERDQSNLPPDHIYV